MRAAVQYYKVQYYKLPITEYEVVLALNTKAGKIMASKMRLVTAVFAVSLGYLLTGTAVGAPKEQRFITIGTGGVTGVYYPAGGAICRLVNKNRKEHGIRCSVESTGGSIYNLNAIREGELDMGVAQSDWQFHAVNGTAKFADVGANKELRALFSLHPEMFTVVARKDANIHTLDDLKGKRVNIGDPGSGQRATLEVLMNELGWKTDVFKLASELKASEQSKALCDNKIDAMIYAVGHPNGAIKEATTMCDAFIVTVSGPQIEAMIKKHPYYSKVVVPGGQYKGNDANVPTLGVNATFVTSSKLSDDVVYEVVKAVFENFDSFVRLHPAFELLDKNAMVTDGLSAPLHPGAVRYYREVGLLK